FAEALEMLAKPRDRIAERPRARFLRRAIGTRVVGGTVPLGAIGKMLDQSRAIIGPRPVRGPLGCGIYRERVIPIDAQAGDTIAHGTRGKGGPLSSGKAG